MTTLDKTKDKEEFAVEFMAKRQKLAADAGMSLYEYMCQVDGGILKNTMEKLARHEQAHPKECPADCAFQASIKRLKEEYQVS
jgi:hypothetical protein